MEAPNKDEQKLPMLTPKNQSGSQRVIKQIMVIDPNKLRVAGLDLKLAEALKKSKGKNATNPKDIKLVLAKSLLNKKLKQKSAESKKPVTLPPDPTAETPHIKVANLKNLMPPPTSPAMTSTNKPHTVLISFLQSDKTTNCNEANASQESKTKDRIPKASTQKPKVIVPKLLDSKIISPEKNFDFMKRVKSKSPVKDAGLPKIRKVQVLPTEVESVTLKPKAIEEKPPPPIVHKLLESKVISPEVNKVIKLVKSVSPVKDDALPIITEVQVLPADVETLYKLPVPSRYRPKVIESKVLSPEEKIDLSTLRVKSPTQKSLLVIAKPEFENQQTVIEKNDPVAMHTEMVTPQPLVEESAVDFINNLSFMLQENTSDDSMVKTITSEVGEDATSFLMSFFGEQSGISSSDVSVDDSSIMKTQTEELSAHVEHEVIKPLAERDDFMQVKELNTINVATNSCAETTLCSGTPQTTSGLSKEVPTLEPSNVEKQLSPTTDNVVQCIPSKSCNLSGVEGKQELKPDERIPNTSALNETLPSSSKNTQKLDEKANALRKGKKSVPVLIAKLKRSRKPSSLLEKPPENVEPILNSAESQFQKESSAKEDITELPPLSKDSAICSEKSLNPTAEVKNVRTYSKKKVAIEPPPSTVVSLTGPREPNSSIVEKLPLSTTSTENTRESDTKPEETTEFLSSIEESAIQIQGLSKTVSITKEETSFSKTAENRKQIINENKEEVAKSSPSVKKPIEPQEPLKNEEKATISPASGNTRRRGTRAMPVMIAKLKATRKQPTKATENPATNPSQKCESPTIPQVVSTIDSAEKQQSPSSEDNESASKSQPNQECLNDKSSRISDQLDPVKPKQKSMFTRDFESPADSMKPTTSLAENEVPLAPSETEITSRSRKKSERSSITPEDQITKAEEQQTALNIVPVEQAKTPPTSISRKKSDVSKTESLNTKLANAEDATRSEGGEGKRSDNATTYSRSRKSSERCREQKSAKDVVPPEQSDSTTTTSRIRKSSKEQKPAADIVPVDEAESSTSRKSSERCTEQISDVADTASITLRSRKSSVMSKEQKPGTDVVSVEETDSALSSSKSRKSSERCKEQKSLKIVVSTEKSDTPNSISKDEVSTVQFEATQTTSSKSNEVVKEQKPATNEVPVKETDSAVNSIKSEKSSERYMEQKSTENVAVTASIASRSRKRSVMSKEQKLETDIVEKTDSVLSSSKSRKSSEWCKAQKAAKDVVSTEQSDTAPSTSSKSSEVIKEQQHATGEDPIKETESVISSTKSGKSSERCNEKKSPKDVVSTEQSHSAPGTSSKSNEIVKEQTPATDNVPIKETDSALSSSESKNKEDISAKDVVSTEQADSVSSTLRSAKLSEVVKEQTPAGDLVSVKEIESTLTSFKSRKSSDRYKEDKALKDVVTSKQDDSASCYEPKTATDIVPVEETDPVLGSSKSRNSSEKFEENKFAKDAVSTEKSATGKVPATEIDSALSSGQISERCEELNSETNVEPVEQAESALRSSRTRKSNEGSRKDKRDTVEAADSASKNSSVHSTTQKQVADTSPTEVKSASSSKKSRKSSSKASEDVTHIEHINDSSHTSHTMQEDTNITETSELKEKTTETKSFPDQLPKKRGRRKNAKANEEVSTEVNKNTQDTLNMPIKAVGGNEVESNIGETESLKENVDVGSVIVLESALTLEVNTDNTEQNAETKKTDETGSTQDSIQIGSGTDTRALKTEGKENTVQQKSKTGQKVEVNQKPNTAAAMKDQDDVENKDDIQSSSNRTSVAKADEVLTRDEALTTPELPQPTSRRGRAKRMKTVEKDIALESTALNTTSEVSVEKAEDKLSEPVETASKQGRRRTMKDDSVQPTKTQDDRVEVSQTIASNMINQDDVESIDDTVQPPSNRTLMAKNDTVSPRSTPCTNIQFEGTTSKPTSKRGRPKRMKANEIDISSDILNTTDESDTLNTTGGASVQTVEDEITEAEDTKKISEPVQSKRGRRKTMKADSLLSTPSADVSSESIPLNMTGEASVKTVEDEITEAEDTKKISEPVQSKRGRRKTMKADSPLITPSADISSESLPLNRTGEPAVKTVEDEITEAEALKNMSEPIQSKRGRRKTIKADSQLSTPSADNSLESVPLNMTAEAPVKAVEDEITVAEDTNKMSEPVQSKRGKRKSVKADSPLSTPIADISSESVPLNTTGEPPVKTVEDKITEAEDSTKKSEPAQSKRGRRKTIKDDSPLSTPSALSTKIEFEGTTSKRGRSKRTKANETEPVSLITTGEAPVKTMEDTITEAEDSKKKSEPVQSKRARRKSMEDDSTMTACNERHEEEVREAVQLKEQLEEEVREAVQLSEQVEHVQAVGSTKTENETPIESLEDGSRFADNVRTTIDNADTLKSSQESNAFDEDAKSDVESPQYESIIGGRASSDSDITPTKDTESFDRLKGQQVVKKIASPPTSVPPRPRLSVDSDGFEECDPDLSMALIDVATAAEEALQKDSPTTNVAVDTYEKPSAEPETAKLKKARNPFKKRNAAESADSKKKKDESDFRGFNEKEIEEGQQSTSLRLSQSQDDVSPTPLPPLPAKKTPNPTKKTAGKKKNVEQQNWKKNSAESLKTWLKTQTKDDEKDEVNTSIPLKKRRGRVLDLNESTQLDECDKTIADVPEQTIDKPRRGRKQTSETKTPTVHASTTADDKDKEEEENKKNPDDQSIDKLKTPITAKGSKRKRVALEESTPETEPPSKLPHLDETDDTDFNFVTPKRGRRSKIQPKPYTYTPVVRASPLEKKFKNDSEFNPRLLLITKKEQLKTDEPLEDPNMQMVPINKDDVQCALCNSYTQKKKWISHVSTHYGIGWIVGNPQPLNVKSRSAVLNFMVDFFRVTKVKGLHCRLCGGLRRSALGLLSHLEQCCLTIDEVKETRVICEHCNNDYSKMTISIHYRTCTSLASSRAKQKVEPKEADTGEQVLSNTGRLKRKSVIIAEDKFKSLDVAEFIPDEVIRHIPVLSTDHLPATWRKEIQYFGKGFCVLKKCHFTSTDIQELVNHCQLGVCSSIQKPGYLCTKCRFTADDIESCRAHVVAEHAPTSDKRRFDNSDDAEFDSESTSETGSSGDDEGESDNTRGSAADNVDGEHKSKRKKKKKKSQKRSRAHLQKSLPTKDFKKLLPDRVSNINAQAGRWYNKLIQKHYTTDALFTFATANALRTDDESYEGYFPKSTISMKFVLRGFKMYCKEIGHTNVESDQWQTLEWLKGIGTPDEHIAYMGGPVRSLAWAPLDPHPASATQYLAITAKKQYDKYTRFTNPRFNRSLIYIHKYHTNDVPEIHGEIQYALMIDTGPVHCIEFLPSGGYAPQMNRLGLLAVGTAQTEVNIYSLPLEVEKRDCDIFPVIRLEPSFVLCLEVRGDTSSEETHEYNSQCMSLAWSHIGGHNYIIGGYLNGFVAIWDISDDDDNLNRFLVNGLRTFVPVSYFCTMDVRIKHLAPHYDINGLRWLVVLNSNRKLLLYDLREISKPFLFYVDTMKNNCNSVDWPLVWENPSCACGDSMPSYGKCINTVSPMSLVFVNRRFDKYCCGVNDLHFNPWRNVYAGAGDNGDIQIAPLREAVLDVGHRMKIDDKVTSTLDLVPLNKDVVINRAGEKLPEGWRLFEPDFKDKYGVVFGSLQRITVSKHPDYYGQKRIPTIGLSRLMRVNRLRFNVNRNADSLLAIGYENGFIRVVRKDWP